MQTLRKRNSPCKYKNEPSRFLGEGMTFKAKLIGILEVNEARGDKMCQDALNDLKTAIRAAGEHKQRITISIAIDGLRLRDEKTADCMYHHPVHKISFIAQDMSDSRAFGYIFGSPDTGHRFFGIKTDKTASQVVISMRDLFQVVFELKKKEIEMARHHIEQHQIKLTVVPTKEEQETDKSKGKYLPTLKTSSISASSIEPSASTSKSNNSEAIADLLDLEHELNSIQQGISQMERITPSDPFGPLGKGDPFSDPFDEKAEVKLKNRSASAGSSREEGEKSTGMFNSGATTSRGHFFSQFSPSISKTKSSEESNWFDQETESLFDDAVTVSNAEPTSSPVTFHTPTAEPPEMPCDDRESPQKTDVFTDLDPLGTGRVKPYVDKKDFFQELKNPPKKVLKELLSETSNTDHTHYFPASFESNKATSVNSTKENHVIKNSFSSTSSNLLNSYPSKDSTNPKYSRVDPFDDTDPFEKSDPFLEESFPQSIGFPPLFGNKTSFETVFQDRATSRHDEVLAKERHEEMLQRMSPNKPSIFSPGLPSMHGPLRVSLPPEKADTSTPLSISTITSKFRSSPSPPEDTKVTRRRYYQTLKQSNDDRNDDSSLEESSSRRSPKPSVSPSKRSPYKEKSYSVRSPPRHERSNSKSSEFVEFCPDPPLKPKAALFSIKPPPLPPKKQNQPTFRPPARPPSLEEYSTHYDYLGKHLEDNKGRFELKDPPKSPCSKRETGKQSPKIKELRKQNSDITSSFSSFPLLPPPPQRKSPAEPCKTTTPTPTEAKEGSILNITLNQLDKTGLENLAVTLGIPSKKIYNMTLQELTKRLAQKYLGPTEVESKEPDEEFQADFDANFSSLPKTTKDSSPPFDKYAVFKELIESEVKSTEPEITEDNTEDKFDEISEDLDIKQEDVKMVDEDGKEEDRYAALRQLSLCAQKSENLSEELDVSNEDDSSARADNISDIIQHNVDGSVSNLNLVNDSPIAKPSLDWPSQPLVGEEVAKEKPEEIEDTLKDTQWDEDAAQNSLEKEDVFPASPPVSEPKAELPVAENWATFEKPLFQEEPTASQRAENENSPLSSDGKEDPKEVSFDWKTKDPRSRRRNEVPWQDEDESWDENSPKDSYWSDESSHDDNSPDKRDSVRYPRKSWNKHTRVKGPYGWTGEEQWEGRDKWTEDTEDEYDESWRRHRRKEGENKTKWDIDYEGYEKGWTNSRGESWIDSAKRGCYTERRKRSESDDDYRRRCDSDASDRECVWGFKRGYHENYGYGDKQKFYGHPMYQSAHWPDHSHESRSKHKKTSSYKRPSSASESKRHYEMMYSPVEHGPKSSGSKRDSSRYHYAMDQYSSYDRRAQPQSHGKRMVRGKRQDSSGSIHKFDMYSPTAKKDDKFYFPPQSLDDAKPDKKPQHFQFEDDFIPSGPEHSKPEGSKKESLKSPRRRRDDWGANGKGGDKGDNNDNFANFNQDFEPPKEPRPKPSLTKTQPKARNHFSILNRQDSSASLRKSESINIFSRENDPFEDDDFFSGSSSSNPKLGRFSSEKSKSNSNVSDPFTWREVFGDTN